MLKISNLLPSARACLILLTAFATSAAGAQGRWTSPTPPSAPNRLGPLCSALVKRLNEMQGLCIKDALDTYPGFSSPPWQKVDAKDHAHLIAELFAYGAGPGAPLLNAHPNRYVSQVEPRVHEFISTGGEIRVWRTRLRDYYEASRRRAPPGKQTVVLMIDKRHAHKPASAKCSGDLSRGQYEYTFIVLPDLSGPDLRVDTGFADLLAESRLVSYHGETLMITFPVNADYTTAYVSPTRIPGGFCSFRFKK